MKPKLPKHDWPSTHSMSVRPQPTRTLYRGTALNNSDLALLNISDAELVFQKHCNFIRVVQKSKTLADAAKKLKLTKDRVRSKTSYLRSKGVPVKSFVNTISLMSIEKWSELRTLARKLENNSIDFEKFVRIWQTKGHGVVMKEFRLSSWKASWIACWLRKKRGVPLRNFRERIDKKALQRIANETITEPSLKIPSHRP